MNRSPEYAADATDLGEQPPIRHDALRARFSGSRGDAPPPMVVGVLGGYQVGLFIAGSIRMLEAKPGISRVFKTSDTAVKYLRRLGADQVLIDFRGFV